MTVDLDWMSQAVCAGCDPEAWFPPGNHNYTAPAQQHAIAFCRLCPVQRECLAYVESFEHGDNRFGLWGGLTPKQRGRRQRKLMREMERSRG